MDTTHYCPACNKGFKTSRGRDSHVRTATACAWYRSGKNRDLTDFEGGHLDIGGIGDMDDWDDMNPGDVMQDMEDVFQFVPLAGSGPIPEVAGPSGGPRSRHVVDAFHLDQSEDSRVEYVHPTAGKVIRMADTLHEQWHIKFGRGDEDIDMDGSSSDKTNFAPFASEMDWKIANWAIKDSPGNAAFDRLLAIPDVRHYLSISAIYILPLQVREKLGLSYKNIRGLHQLVDEIPSRATWKTRYLSFSDRPDEKYRIHFRDPLEAIKSLWADPTHAADLVYAPKQVFSDSTRKSRIYSEMWTGKWWNGIQKVYL